MSFLGVLVAGVGDNPHAAQSIDLLTASADPASASVSFHHC